jgi:hypothetical protein
VVLERFNRKTMYREGSPAIENDSDALSQEIARAALLALAEVELPEEVLEASAEACCDARAASIEKQIEFRERNGIKPLEKYGVAPAEWLPPTFRAMLRGIANSQ